MARGTDDRRASVEVQQASVKDGPVICVTEEASVSGRRHAQASTSEGLDSTGEASTAFLSSREAFLADLQPGRQAATGELQAPELLPSISSLCSVGPTSTCESTAKDKDGKLNREQHEPLAASKVRPGCCRPPPKEKGDSSSARRLRLEHTFNQGNESRLEKALSGLHQAAHTEHQLQQSLMQAAEAVNRVRYQQAEDLDQLRDMMVGVFLDVPSIAAVTKTAGGLTHCLPFVVIPSFRNKVFEDSSSRAGAVWFSEGPLAGLRIPLTTIYRACSSYTGEPCNLLDPDDCPPSLRPLHRIMYTQNQGIMHVYLQMGKTRSSEEVRRLAAQLRVMMDELMSIQTAILFSNLRLAGSLTPAQPLLSPQEWHSMMAALKLSEEQVQKCRDLRAHLKRRFATVQMAKQCSQDLLDDMVGGVTSTSLPLSTESAMQLLDIAAARRKAGFDMQTLWTEATIRLAFDILSSEQNSMRMAVRAVASSLKGRRASQNDYMYFHLYSFVDAEMSRWMDVLPSASGRSAQQSMGL